MESEEGLKVIGNISYCLVQGNKPPPLTMLSPAGSKVARNTATVPPLNQVSPSNGLNSVTSNSALNATRTSSFAAALRKLAYQAKDPADEVIKHSSPNSNNSSPRSSTPKRAPPPLVYSSQSTTLTSPPVVTIAPTPSHQHSSTTSLSANTDHIARHGLDRIPSGHSLSSSYESIALKQEREQRPLSGHSRDDDRNSKDGLSMAHAARITPQSSTSGGLMTGNRDDITRGFQPYRHGDDIRPPVPPGFGMDPAYAAYHSALLASHYSHPAYRLEDPLLLERYRMMQPSLMMPFSHPGMMAAAAAAGHHGVHPLLAGGRYPPELLHQYPYISPSAAQSLDPRSPALSAERARLEEERQREIDREKEKDREKEREKEKWREKEREKEATQRLREREIERERMKMERQEHERHYLAQNSHHQNDINHRIDHRDEGSKHGSITQGTPRDSYNDKYKQQQRHDHHIKQQSLLDHRNHHREYGRNMMSVEGQRRSDIELSRGQPPPLISPKEPGELTHHRSDTGLFRPFEKESRSSYPLEIPTVHNRKLEHSVQPLKIPQREITQDKHKNYLGEHDQMRSLHANHDRRENNHDNYSLKRQYNDVNKMKSSEVSNELMPNNKIVHVAVSKLDKEEARLREARLKGTYHSDDDEEDMDDSEKEEDKIERMMLIRNGPPMPLDKSVNKLKFLSSLGLFTIRRKKDKDFERYRKRRKYFREQSLSPIIVEEDTKSKSESLTIPKLDPDILCSELDYPNKCNFLSSFKLQHLEKEERKELCLIREACQLEKKRRLGGTDVKDERLSTQLDKKGIKRKRVEDNNNTDLLNTEPIQLTLAQLQQRHQQQTKLNNLHNKMSDNRSTVIFPTESCDRGKILSREFAEQFHESVLQTTREKELQSRLGNSRHDGTNLSSDKTSPSKHHVSSDGIGCSSLSDQSETSSFRWPGITAVMEAYQRHSEEQKSEHGILSERCKKLQSENRDLNKKAEALSKAMAMLLEQQKHFEEERNRNQAAIEKLTKPLRQLR
ncbi:hypothetical protein LOTGIDRAFT_229786 [Lottia gigantea]|uniref:Genetic suppressor element-like domain-containing protein n=1 Tax=Lottia gigantea TaxID=225164 RepID=V3ZPI3_LOTGI|nr:hypothetical protein LOTGIDRAFT_229786 [Lottia gigantea]ESO82761.1 hypothetical protein LOTGIDRAFT_229786 [Lottia gigantea]